MELKEVLKKLVSIINPDKIIPISKSQGHYLLIKSGKKYYVVITRRTLRKPKSLNINSNNEMLGIRRDRLLKATYVLNVNTVIFALIKNNSIELYFAEPHQILHYSSKNETCVKIGTEVICHYPLNLMRKATIPTSKTLNNFLA